MPTFLVTSQHSPENCPIHNERTRESSLKNLSILEDMTKKHGVRILGNYIIMYEHKAYFIIDAPHSRRLPEDDG
jgi:hypothetical protein